MQLSKRYSLFAMLMLALFINSQCQDKPSSDNTVTNEDTSFIRKEYHLTHTRKNPDGRQVYQTWTNNNDSSKIIIKLYIDDKLVSVGAYKNREHEGIDIRCYPDGIVWIRQNFVDGKRHGPVKYYDEKGKLFAIEEYDHGVLLHTKEIK